MIWNKDSIKVGYVEEPAIYLVLKVSYLMIFEAKNNTQTCCTIMMYICIKTSPLSSALQNYFNFAMQFVQVYCWWLRDPAPRNIKGILATPPKATPPRNKALLRVY